MKTSTYPCEEPKLPTEALEAASETLTQVIPDDKIFPFLKLSAELRNHIYLDILGPVVPRPPHPSITGPIVLKPSRTVIEKNLWPNRKFNTALFVLNRQIHHEFTHILWKVLDVEWTLNGYHLHPTDVRLFTSIKYLQRCKLIISIDALRYANTIHGITDDYLTSPVPDIEETVFGLPHKLNRMLHLEQIHIEYHEDEDSYEGDYWVRSPDDSLLRYVGADLKTVFGIELRGVKKVRISGSLCDECSALLSSAIQRPKDTLPEVYRAELEQRIPRTTLPQWSDKVRGWT